MRLRALLFIRQSVLVHLVASMMMGAIPKHVIAQQGNAAIVGQSVQVALVTIGPGPIAWERFGHNAIWVRDTLTGFDRMYDWGRFSFRQEDFVVNFLQAKMNYWMASEPSDDLFRRYRFYGRSIFVQELELSPYQRVTLLNALIANDTNTERYYQYDYYLDNCSTRIRDAIDSVLGNQIREATADTPSGSTFRSHTRRLTSPDLPLYMGLHSALGRSVDRPISAWDEMFLPMKLREHLREIEVPVEGGGTVPLVRREYTYYEGVGPNEVAVAPNWTLKFFAVSAIGALVMWSTLVLSLRRAGFVRIIFKTIFGIAASLWVIYVALGGTILLGFWAFTRHTVAFWNENLLSITPLAVPLLLTVPMALGGSSWGIRWSARVALAVAGSSILGVVVQVIPGVDQVNGEVLGLMVPANLGLAAALWHWRRVHEASPSFASSGALSDSSAA